MRIIIVIVTLWIFCAIFTIVGCNGKQDVSKSVVYVAPPVVPQRLFFKGQIVYIYGEKPGIISDTLSESDSMYRYNVSFIAEDRVTITFNENELLPTKTSNATIIHDTVRVGQNDLGAESWAKNQFLNTRLAIHGYLVEAREDVKTNEIYSAGGMYRRLRTIDSVFKEDSHILENTVATGNIPNSK